MARIESPDNGDEPLMRFLDQWVWPYFEESALWPVLFALLAHLVVLLGLLLLQAWRSAAPWAWAGIVFLGLISFDLLRREIRYRGRPGRLAGLVVASWALGVITAVGTGYWGIF